jgi:TusA-related sulfurtransferase
MKEMAPNQVLEILSDDEGIRKDMPIWCRDTGNEFVDLIEDGNVLKVYVRKKTTGGSKRALQTEQIKPQ